MVALSLLAIACGSAGESETSKAEASPSTPPPVSERGTTTTCAPSILLGDPIAEPLSFTCPIGWAPRAKNNSLPVSDRFTTAREMVDALCTQSDEGAMDPSVVGVDFEDSDVLAVAYRGEIGLCRRGGELWIRQTDTCTASYRTALFVVPKGVEPHEQTCAAPCDGSGAH